MRDVHLRRPPRGRDRGFRNLPVGDGDVDVIDAALEGQKPAPRRPSQQRVLDAVEGLLDDPPEGGAGEDAQPK